MMNSSILKHGVETASFNYCTIAGQGMKLYFSDLDSIDKNGRLYPYLVGPDI